MPRSVSGFASVDDWLMVIENDDECWRRSLGSVRCNLMLLVRKKLDECLKLSGFMFLAHS